MTRTVGIGGSDAISGDPEDGSDSEGQYRIGHGRANPYTGPYSPRLQSSARTRILGRMHRNHGRPSDRTPDPLSPVARRSAAADPLLRAKVGPPGDEAEADAARRRLRKQGMIAIEPDCQVAGLLDVDELLVAIRHAVHLDRRQPGPLERRGLPGNLYVTTRRLLHLGSETISYDLARIREAVIAGDELMLMLDDGQGVAISTGNPNLLRIEIAAARSAARGAHRTVAATGGSEREP